MVENGAETSSVDFYAQLDRFKLEWGKSPILCPPSPPRKSAIFGVLSPKKPQNFTFPRPHPVPEDFEKVPPSPPRPRASGRGTGFPGDRGDNCPLYWLLLQIIARTCYMLSA